MILITDLLNDSKQVSEEIRYQLRIEIEERAIAYAVASVDNFEIDEINILNASFLAMHRAIEKLHIAPQFLIIDGNRFNKYKSTPHACVIQGDGKYFSIRGSIDTGQNLSRRLYVENCRRTSRIRLAHQQRLSNHKTPRNCYENWVYAISS
jgi:hypothetical protein